MATVQQQISVGSLPQEFARIFEAHHGLVYRAAFRITGNAEDAEDVLQILFLRLLRRGRALDQEANPKGYLHRAAVNIALDLVRLRKRSVSADDIPAYQPDHGSSDRVRGMVAQALGELSPKLAELFVLKHVEGLDNAEIAQLIGTSRGAVAVMLFRARTRLKKSIRAQLRSRS
jgi:RNA polymerase sigma-70 factor (ECF subfamily)